MKIFYEARNKKDNKQKRPGQIILPQNYLAYVSNLVHDIYPNNPHECRYNEVIFFAEDNNIKDENILRNFPKLGFEFYSQKDKLLFITPVPELQRGDNEYMQYAVPHSDGHTDAKVLGFFLKFERPLNLSYFSAEEFIKAVEYLASGEYDQCQVSDDGYWVFVYNQEVSTKYGDWFKILLNATDDDFGKARKSIPDVVSWRSFVESLRNTIY